MLPKVHRIGAEKEFNDVFRKGYFLRSVFFTAKIAKNDRGVVRFGFVVSKKIAQKATDRNLIKRRLSEAVKFFLGKLKDGYDIVIVAQPPIVGKGFEEIKEEIRNLFCKGRLLYSKSDHALHNRTMEQ